MNLLGANLIIPYVALVIMAAVGFGAGIVCSISAVRLIRRQIKLNNSITLVELKSGKLHYLIFFVLVSVFIIVSALSLVGVHFLESEVTAYGMEPWQAAVMLMFLLLLLLSVDFLLAVLFFAKSAVVDRGIYTELYYLDWYHVHDYIIDESTGIVIISTQKETFSTLKGTTLPLRIAKNDIPKIKFILNKNKNKFSGT